MIVLAIASVILLGVLLVVPALQRSGRNAARERDIGVILATINNYRGSFNALPDKTPLGVAVHATEGFNIGGKITGELSYYNNAARNHLTVLTSGDLTDDVNMTTGVLTAPGSGTACDRGDAASGLCIANNINDLVRDTGEELILLITEQRCEENAVATGNLEDLVGATPINAGFALVYQLEGDEALICRDNV